MNRNRKKAAAATLAAGMAVVLGAGTVMAAASTGDNGLQKEETVYVNTTAGGEVTDVTVSDWLKNSGDSSNSEVKDASDLQDIKNVKGDETFTQNGNDLTWSTDGKDIYYQGKTEKNLPVSVGIKYYMDGTEVSPEALAGKTGHLKMEVTYANTSKTTKTVNGKKTDIYSRSISSSAVRSMFTTSSAVASTLSGTRSWTSMPVISCTCSFTPSMCWMLTAEMTLIPASRICITSCHRLGFALPSMLVCASSSTTTISGWRSLRAPCPCRRACGAE